MKLKYSKRMMFAAAVIVSLLFVGCGNSGNKSVSGTNYYYPKNETEEKAESEKTGDSIRAELGSEYYMIVSNDMTKEYFILQQIASGKQYLYQYSITTKFLDKYGDNTSAGSFEPGRIITIGEKDTEGRLKSAQISNQVWEYEDVVKYKIDIERGVFTIANTNYVFEEDVFAVSAGNEISLADIKSEDELRIIGMNKEILSVAVTTGQGTIALKNTELFEGSFIQIGSKIFAEITGEMQLEIPEGAYTVTVANKGYGGSQEYEVVRDAVTEIDLEQLKGEGPKMGTITFLVGTEEEESDAEIKFLVDGKEVDDTEPVDLAYGIHSIFAEADGYESYAKKLFVNSETATITIALEANTPSVDTGSETSQEEETIDTDVDLAGSLAGSMTAEGSAENAENSSDTDTDALIEALTNALSGNSSTDYLSTLTELLGSIM